MLDYLLIEAANGLVIGIILALIASGLTIIFSILKIVNFAHGELYMMGGYFGYYVITLLGISPFPAVLAAMALSFVFAVAIERGLLTPLYSPTIERKAEYGILITFALSVFLRNLAVILFGPFPLRPPSFFAGELVFGGLIIDYDRLVAAGGGLLLLGALIYFLNRTVWGQALNAVSQSPASASIVGINSERMYMLAFGVGGALAGGAGALIAPIYSLSPGMGLVPDTQAFVIVILGGMGSVSGSIIAAVLLGLSENLFIALFPDPSRGPSYANAFGLFIMMLVLLFRPTGVFGRQHVAME